MLRALIIAGLLMASLACKGSTNPSGIDDKAFSPALFANPPAEFGPQTRWWWPGASVDDAGLRDQLRQFADAGYSAIEIQPFMSALTNADLSVDPRIRAVGDATFLERLRTAACTAQELIETLRARLQDRGIELRLQAHGGYADVLDAYAMANVPESEALYAGGSYDFLRLSASAAHVAGKRYVSSEQLRIEDAFTDVNVFDPETGQSVAAELEGDVVTVALSGARGTVLWVTRPPPTATASP